MDHKIRDHASKNSSVGGFLHPLLKGIFESGWVRRICSGVHDIVNEDASKAVRLIRGGPEATQLDEKAQLDGLMEAGSASLVAPCRALSLYVLDPVTYGMNYVINRHTFLPLLATAVFVYWKMLPLSEGTDGAPFFSETDFDAAGLMTLGDFKELASSYQHMKTLLEVHASAQSDLSIFYPHSEEVDEAIGSSKYRQMVEFLVNSDEFWRDGEVFVKLVEPLLKLFAVLTLSGATIGHQRRCFEATTELYAGFLPTWEGILKNSKELWDVSKNPLSMAAVVLDPAYLFLPGFDRFDAAKRLLEFKEEYVLEIDKVNFQNDVDAYLGKSPVLFDAAAMTSRNQDHPVYFWHYFGRPLPTLRRYAKKLVFLKTIPSAVELEALFANEKELDKDEMNSAALRGYEQCDAERLAAFLLQIGDSRVGYLEFWCFLKKVDEEGWRSISGRCPSFYLFCWTFDSFL